MENSAAKNNSTLIKATGVVQAVGDFSLAGRKMYNVLLKNAHPRVLTHQNHQISVRDLMDSMGWKKSGNWDEVKKELTKLKSVDIQFNFFGTDKKNIWLTMAPLSWAAIEGGMCLYEFPAPLRPALAEPNIYANFSLLTANKFRGRVSAHLYEHFIDSLGRSGSEGNGTKWFSLSEFRKYLGVGDSEYYSNYNKLKQKILRPALSEINAVSEIDVVLFEKSDLVDRPGQGRGKPPITHIRFTITPKEGFSISNYPKEDIPLLEGEQASALLALLEEKYGIAGPVAQNLISSYLPQRIRGALDYVDDQLRGGASNIQNIAAYTVNAIREGYEKKSDDGEKKAQIAEARAELAPLQEKIKRIEELFGDFYADFIEEQVLSVGDEQYRTAVARYCEENNPLGQTREALKKKDTESFYFKGTVGKLLEYLPIKEKLPTISNYSKIEHDFDYDQAVFKKEELEESLKKLGAL